MSYTNRSDNSGKFLVPSTPPRLTKSSKKHFKTPSQFGTPITPNKLVHGPFITPVSTAHRDCLYLLDKGTKTNESTSEGIPNPLTPEFTPHKSPRRSQSKRKKNALDVISNDMVFMDAATSNEKKGFLGDLLLPAPSTIGTGRRVSSSIYRHQRPITQKQEPQDSIFSKDEVSPSIKDAPNPQVSKHFKIDKPFIKSANLSKLDYNFETPLSPTRKITSNYRTPGEQIIDEQTVERWYGKSHVTNFSDSEDSEDEIIKDEGLKNPFENIENVSKRLAKTNNPFVTQSAQVKTNQVDYSTHNEYFNPRTKERIIVELTEEEKNIKPKKLDFTSI